MKFKIAYLIIIVIAFLGLPLVYAQAPLIYFLYGYDSTLIGSSSTQAYAAFNETVPARNLLYLIVAGSTFLCFIFSCIAIYRRIYLKYHFTYIAFIFSLLLMFLYYVASLIPRRSF